MIPHHPIASAELAMQLLEEASLFLDDFCIDHGIPLEVAIGMTMTAADAKGGYGIARAMQKASKMIISNHGPAPSGNRHDRRKEMKETARLR